MQKALEDGAPLLYFADIWLSVLNDTVDSQAEFQASKQQSNMDFTTKPRFAQLAKQGEYREQTVYDKPTGLPQPTAVRSGSFTGGPSYSYIKLILADGGRWISDIEIRVWMFASVACVAALSIVSEDRGTVVASSANSVTIPAGTPYEGNAFFTFAATYLDAGVYWIRCDSLSDDYYTNYYIKYQSTDVYADSEHYYETPLGTPNPTGFYGDAYFKINLEKYASSGSFLTKRLDLGETPADSGTFQMSFSHPVGTGLVITLYGYTTETDTSPAVTYTNAQDGQAVAPYRYWEVYVAMTSNAGLDQTPVVDLLEILFPKKSLLLSEKGKGLINLADDIKKNYRAMLTGAEYGASDMNIIERVSTGGNFTATIEDTTDVGEVIQRVISDSPLLNYRAILYIGADVPGFSETDLLRFFIGTVQAGKYKPKYRKAFHSLQLTIKNSTLELSRKVPQIPKTGSVTLADTSINYDGTHAIDAMVDLARSEARIPARYMNLPSFDDNRSLVGPLYVVRRSNSPVRYNPKIGTPAPNNTGTGTTSNVSVTTPTKIGVYTLVCITAAAGSGTFSVTDPNGTAMANATVGTDYNTTEILFLINAGTVDYIVGDRFTITILSPDTRLKSPEEIRKHYTALAIIADGYIVTDEDSRVTFVRHDATAAPEAAWADEALVRAGLDAIPIEQVDEIDLGYDTRMYNAALMAAEWDGSGGDWTAFTEMYSYVDATAVGVWAPGKAEFLRVMEKNMKEASKWLGPEAGYNGETIAANLTQRFVERFAYPPVIMSGVVVPQSQFLLTQGSVVQIWSKEFAKFRRRGIALSETLTFMVMSKKLDRAKNRVVFKLMELT